MKKQRIGDKMYDVISYNDYISNPNIYDPLYTAIEENGIAYPIKNRNDNRPGFYQGSNNPISYYNKPSINEMNQFSIANAIDFSNINNISEAIDKAESLKENMNKILTSPDNITKPNIGEHDTPQAKGMKQVVVDKHIDINKYKERIGEKFTNDIKFLKSDDITLKKAVDMGTALDVTLILEFRDKHPDVANPMGKIRRVQLNNFDYTIVGDDMYE